MLQNLLSGLIGSVIGGIVAIVTTIITLNIQNKNQIRIAKDDDTKKEKAAFLSLNDEIEENIMNIKGYIKFMDANSKTRVYLKRDNVNVLSNTTWINVRDIIFLSSNNELSKELSLVYKGVHGFKNLDIAEREIIDKFLIDLENIKKNISQYISKI